MKLSATKSFGLFTTKAPDWLFALCANYYYHLHPNKERITIIPKGKHWLVLRDNFKFLCPTAKFLGTSMKTFESRFEQCLKIERGDTVVDVGACMGETAIPPLIKVGENGFVIAIEAEPRNIKYLKANTSIFNNVKIVEKAVWNRKEKVKLYLSYSIAGHSIFARSDSYIEVEADTLDNILRGLKRIDFLKIDVQGVELQVLEGAEKTLETTRKVVVETHGWADKSTAPEVIEFLKQRKFKIKVTTEKYVPENTLFQIVHAWK